ncbi:tail fiber domain-containing protein [Candidatus Saccharibacteria bacterium]|nr:tail fiber domain-containing protein [Candidatus Saccharibacteria bacterium]
MVALEIMGLLSVLGRGTGSAIGGAINFQTSAAGASGSTLRSLSTVASFAGGTGYATFQNTANTSSSFTAFQVLNSTSGQIFGIDTGANTNVAKFTGSDGINQCTVQVGTGWSCTSDEQLKTNIVNMDTLGVLDQIGALRPVTYNWTAEASGDSSLQYGFIAQDVEKIFPAAVGVDPTTGYKMINQGRLLTFTIAGLKDANTKLSALNAAIDTTKPNAITLNQPTTLKQGLTVNGQTTLTGPTTLSGDVKFVGGAEFDGVVQVNGRLQLGSGGVSKNTGTVTIPAGSTSIHVAFPSGFSATPNVTLTPRDFLSGQYRATNVTSGGFDLQLSAPEQSDKSFYWQAF